MRIKKKLTDCFSIYTIHLSGNQKTLIESLHPMFIGYVQGKELNVDQRVIDSYLQIRYLLQETKELFNAKNQ